MVGSYFDPASHEAIVAAGGRPIPNRPTSPGPRSPEDYKLLVGQLRRGEVLVGLYHNWRWPIAPDLYQCSEYLEFEQMLRAGKLKREGRSFYALPLAAMYPGATTDPRGAERNRIDVFRPMAPGPTMWAIGPDGPVVDEEDEGGEVSPPLASLVEYLTQALGDVALFRMNAGPDGQGYRNERLEVAGGRASIQSGPGYRSGPSTFEVAIFGKARATLPATWAPYNYPPHHETPLETVGPGVSWQPIDDSGPWLLYHYLPAALIRQWLEEQGVEPSSLPYLA